MKKIFFILFSVFFISISAFSQRIALSPELDTRNDYTFDLLGKVGEKILAFRKKNKKYILNIYDQNLYRFVEKRIFLEDKNTELVSVTTRKMDFTVIYSYKVKGKILIKAVKYDETGVKLDSTEISAQKNFFTTKKYLYTISTDKNKVLIYRIIDNNEMEFILFDIEKFKRTYYRKVKFSGIKLNYNFRQITVSNESDIYVLFEKPPTIFNKKNHKIIINAFYTATKERKNVIKALKFNSANIKMVYDNKNNVLNVVGAKTKLYEVKTTGYFVFKFDKYLKIKSQIDHSFKKYLFSKYYKLQHKRHKNYIKNLKLKDIELRNDGGMVFLFEVQEVIKRNINSFSYRQEVFTGDTDFIFEDIVLVSLHENGDEFWEKIIHKYQMSTNDYGLYSSFFVFKVPSEIKLIFNDEIKNKTQVIMYSIDPIGKIKRKSIFSTDQYKLNLAFIKAVQISNRAFVVPSFKKEKLKLVLVEF